MGDRPPQTALDRLIGEVRRRRVSSVALTYAAVGWLAIEIVATTFPMLGIPDRAQTVVLLLVLLGFPVALVLGWVFDLTPEGIRRTDDLGPETEVVGGSGPGVSHSRAWVLVALGAAIGAGTMWWTSRTPPADDIRSIAVLPLANLAGQDEEAYFVDGMHDAMINELGKLSELTVVSRTSVQRYRATALSMGQVGAELGVQGIVEGSVFRSGDSVRISVQLFRAQPEQALWTNTYEGPIGEALTLHRRVARAVADEISLTLAQSTRDRLADMPAIDPAVQEAYLRGRHHLRNRNLSASAFGEVERGLAFLVRAIELDPSFAPAHAALAEARTHRGTYGMLTGNLSLAEAEEERRAGVEHARRAIELDPLLGEGHSALGNLVSYDMEWQEALEALRRAITLKPSDAQAHDFLGDLYSMLGDADAAVASFERARELDPLSPIMNNDLARGLRNARRCSDAIPYARDALELDPAGRLGWTALVECLATIEDFDGASEAMAAALRSEGAPASLVASFDSVAAAGGWMEALAWLADRPQDELQFGPGGYEVGFPGLEFELRASVLGYLGRPDGALDALELALSRGSPILEVVAVLHPWLDPIRDDPRYVAVMRARRLVD